MVLMVLILMKLRWLYSRPGKKCFKINSTISNNFSKTSIDSDIYRVEGNTNSIKATVTYYAKTSGGNFDGKYLKRIWNIFSLGSKNKY